MKSAWMLAVLLLICSRTVASQTISVSGDPAPMTVSNAVAGTQPIAATGATLYTISTPKGGGNRSFAITAQLNAPMPAGVTLTATFAVPTAGGTSLGAVTLDATTRDVITNLPKNVNSTQGITYQVAAVVSAGVVSTSTRVVTLTILQTP